MSSASNTPPLSRRRLIIGAAALATTSGPAAAGMFSCETIDPAWRPTDCSIPEAPSVQPRQVEPRRDEPVRRSVDLAGYTTRRFHMHAPRIGERLDVVYFRDGEYIGSALQSIYRLMRDHYDGSTHRITINLIDTLALALHRSGSSRPLELVSGFRSSATNQMLIAQSIARNGRSGVAQNSFHLYGRAADLRHPDLSLTSLARLGRAAGAGGVSRYSSSNFVHLDDGPVRGNWSS